MHAEAPYVGKDSGCIAHSSTCMLKFLLQDCHLPS